MHPEGEGDRQVTKGCSLEEWKGIALFYDLEDLLIQSNSFPGQAKENTPIPSCCKCVRISELDLLSCWCRGGGGLLDGIIALSSDSAPILFDQRIFLLLGLELVRVDMEKREIPSTSHENAEIGNSLL